MQRSASQTRGRFLPASPWRVSRPLYGRRCRRGAALYLITVSIAMLVAGMGLSLIAIQRGERRLQSNLGEMAELQWAARAGIEEALQYLDRITDWRQRVVGNCLLAAAPVGEATVRIDLFDDKDGNLTNSQADPVRLLATARRGNVTCKLQVQLKPKAHPALQYALFGTSVDDMEFRGNAGARGPVRSHGKIKAVAGNTTADDAAFETKVGYPIDDPLGPKSYVSSDVAEPVVNLDVYKALATPITGTYGARCELKGYNLTPTYNPVGAPNANGIYSLDAGGREVYFENLHLRGTLIVFNTSGKKVSFHRGLRVEIGPLNYPTLLVSCPSNDLDFHLDSADITESTVAVVIGKNGVNYNLGLGMDLNEDGDVFDSWYCKIRGIVWSDAARVLVEGDSYPLMGSLIARKIIVDHWVRVDNDLTLMDTAAPGFVQSGMSVVPGSYREVP